jgi:hypothetical protein
VEQQRLWDQRTITELYADKQGNDLVIRDVAKRLDKEEAMYGFLCREQCQGVKPPTAAKAWKVA